MQTRGTQRRAHVGNWVAIAVAIALLLGGGVWYRIQAARYVQYGSSVPIPPGTLALLPLQIGGWTGEEVPMEARVVQATDTDDHVNRMYARQGGVGRVMLFVGYGVKLRDLAPHRPEVCYPGAGWTMIDKEVVELKSADGQLLPCQIYRFRQGGLVTQEITVLNYYIVDGQCWPDVELLREKAALPSTDARYMAQVQVTCLDTPFQRTSKPLVCEFASASAPSIQKLLSDATSAAGGTE